ncbi:hypothetical protein [Corynebacterium lehmanniae]|jgi:hypothetical protein
MSDKTSSNPFSALAVKDEQSRKEGAGFGTDRGKPGRKSSERHRTSFAFPIEDWEVIERLADHYGRRHTLTDTIVRAVRETAQRENLID